MKKLKIKVFGTILFILTFFLSIVLIFFNYQSYKAAKSNVHNILLRMNDSHIKEPPGHFNGNDIRDKIFMDSIVYTVFYNENEINEIINHNELINNSSDIEKFANKVINGNNKTDYKIGNLYFNNYSYSFIGNNSLIIIDNSTFTSELLPLLQMSIIIFILLELLFVLITTKLTSWIIKPVEESFEKQKQFIADASHELKTPLTVILANTEALERDRNETKWFNNIKSEIERMNKLITNLLDLAKLENKNNSNFNVNDLSKLVEMEVLTFESLIYERNLILDYNIHPNVNFNCDKDQIKQLISILLDNAIKHSYDNSPITINLYLEKKDIVLEVKNKGDELSKEDEEKIFERFYRVDESRNRDSNRYGLGLAIAKNIVLNHNGIISASSYENETTFKIIFKQV